MRAYGLIIDFSNFDHIGHRGVGDDIDDLAIFHERFCR